MDQEQESRQKPRPQLIMRQTVLLNVEQEPRWRPTRRQILWAGAAVGLVLLTVAVVIGYRYDITLWDWVKLLIVPVVIAGGVFWFNRQQREREIEIARQQREQELEIAENRTQDEALQAYLDQMSDMLIPNTGQPSLYKAQPGDSLSSVARARTLTVLQRLAGDRRASVVQFLYESGLIFSAHPVLALSGANLGEVNLRKRTNLSGADLSETILRRAFLDETILREANFREAYLMWSHLEWADLREANLRGADLRGADLRGADGTTNAQLEEPGTLEGAIMPTGQKYEDWIIDPERIEGATMPEGAIYEERIEYKESYKEDAKND